MSTLHIVHIIYYQNYMIRIHSVSQTYRPPFQAPRLHTSVWNALPQNCITGSHSVGLISAIILSDFAWVVPAAPFSFTRSCTGFTVMVAIWNDLAIVCLPFGRQQGLVCAIKNHRVGPESKALKSEHLTLNPGSTTSQVNDLGQGVYLSVTQWPHL